MPGPWPLSEAHPGTFSSFRTFSKNFTTHNPKSCSPVGAARALRNLPPPQFQSDTSQILAAAGPFPTLASNSAADDKRLQASALAFVFRCISMSVPRPALST